MRAVAARLRVALRSRRTSALAIVLLIAVAGGAAMTAAAGARRTASAYPRMLEAGNAFDVLVNPDADDVDYDAIESLPQVVDAARLHGMFAAPADPNGLPDFDNPLLPAASDGRWGYEVGRPVNAVLAAVGVAHALVVAARRRRHDLAVLRVLGFRRRQTRAAIAWQASALVVLGVVVGVPLGLAVGRWAWALVARSLGVLEDPALPVATLVLLPVAALLAANAIAAVPAHWAVAVPPGPTLRSE